MRLLVVMGALTSFSAFAATTADSCKELVCACEYDTAAAVRVLLVDGVDSFCHLEENGITPLMAAITNAREGGKIADALIKVGVDVNARDKQGRTALMYAAQHGRYDYFCRLLAAGANVHARDNAGMSVLMYTCVRQSWHLHEWACAQVEKPYMHGGSAHRVQMVRKLHSLGADINAVDAVGRSPLMFAVLHNWPALVDELIALGADIQHADEAGRTPLICEAQKRLGKGTFEEFLSQQQLSTHIFESLLHAGADLYAADTTGDTTLKILMRVQDSAAMKVFLHYERLYAEKYWSLFPRIVGVMAFGLAAFLLYHFKGSFCRSFRNLHDGHGHPL